MKSFLTSSTSLDGLGEANGPPVRRDGVVDTAGCPVDDLLGGERPCVDDVGLLSRDFSSTVVELRRGGGERKGEVGVGVEEGSGQADGEGGRGSKTGTDGEG